MSLLIQEINLLSRKDISYRKLLRNRSLIYSIIRAVAGNLSWSIEINKLCIRILIHPVLQMFRWHFFSTEENLIDLRWNLIHELMKPIQKYKRRYCPCKGRHLILFQHVHNIIRESEECSWYDHKCRAGLQ